MVNLQSRGQVPIDIGSRLELMLDEYLIARMSGGAELCLNKPIPREIVLETNEAWEGNACGYHTIFQDGDIYRMYYRGWHFDLTEDALTQPRQPVVCYAESTDGIHWVKPELGLVEFTGPKKNNIILDSLDPSFPAFRRSGELRETPCFAPFKDINPNAAADAKYKAWVVGADTSGLFPLKSPDGIHWSPMSEKSAITYGRFDSQNLAFWDSVRGEYRDYHRQLLHQHKSDEEPYAAHTVGSEGGETVRGSRHGRDILTATSSDFIHWTEPVLVNYTQGRTNELYTNQITPYYRAPHIFMGFPARYVERPWSAAIEDLPEVDHRRLRTGIVERYGTALTDGMFMSSRDGLTFNLWPDSFIRPGLRPRDNWAYADNFQNWGIVTTQSSFVGAPDELSIYLNEGYWRGESTKLRRYTLRVDGFVSVRAPLSGGELVTKPLIFTGRQLVLNFSASAAGSIRVEILRDQMDTPLEDFTLDACVEVLGDDLERVVRWSDGPDVSQLAGSPVRLRFVLKDADLFSLRFVE